jgi:hypothetical protein
MVWSSILLDCPVRTWESVKLLAEVHRLEMTNTSVTIQLRNHPEFQKPFLFPSVLAFLLSYLCFVFCLEELIFNKSFHSPVFQDKGLTLFLESSFTKWTLKFS